MRKPSSRSIAAAALLLLASMAGCGSGRPAGTRSLERPPEARLTVGDATGLYHSVGLAAAAEPVPFVGAAAHFASPAPDTTLTLVTVSLPNRALTFTREGDRYRGSYAVEIRILRDGIELSRIDALEVVRVGTFRETGRTDESVVFQRWLTLEPGPYTLRLSVRDVGGSRASTDTLAVRVPRLAVGEGGISTPIPVYEARGRTRLDTMPVLLPRPRATAIFGRDTVIGLYVEGYGAAGSQRLPVVVTVRDERSAVAWSDTASIPRRGDLFGATINVPVSGLGVGVGSVSVTAANTAEPRRSPVFLTFGDDLPLAPFEDMLSYLRFFASAPRLRELRDAPPERRAEAWAAFLRQTDPAPHTPEHEALQAYFSRIQLANVRFRDDGSIGWLTDRGVTFVALGEPDNVLEQTATQSGGRRIADGPYRVQIWEYATHRARFFFTDEQTTGRFRFVPRSESEFRTLLQRILVH